MISLFVDPVLHRTIQKKYVAIDHRGVECVVVDPYLVCRTHIHMHRDGIVILPYVVPCSPSYFCVKKFPKQNKKN